MSTSGFGYGVANPPFVASIGTTWNYTVANAAARLALTPQVGQTARQTDIQRTFILLDDSPMIWGELEAEDINQWLFVSAIPNTSFINVGLGLVTGSGSIGGATFNNTNPGKRLNRINFNSVAAINSAMLNSGQTNLLFPGGGIRFVTEFNLELVGANQRWGVGYCAAAPSAVTDVVNNINCVFIGRGNNEANIQFYINDGAGVCDQTDLGASFPAATTDSRYFLELYSFDGTTWVMNLLNVTTRAEVSLTATGANVPAVGTAQTWRYFGNTVSTGTSLSIGFGSVKQAQINRI